MNSVIKKSATTSWKKLMQAVRQSETGPWSIVVTENKKVVSQAINLRVVDALPAHYEAARREYPKLNIHIEDGTGNVVWNSKQY